MGSLEELIQEEIDRRESVKDKKEKEAEERKKENFIKAFEDELFKLLNERREYMGHLFPANAVCRKDISKIAAELGFVIDRRMAYSYADKQHYLLLSVPKPELGKQITFAQERLKKFEKALETEKQLREQKIAKECQRILKEIEAGRFEYTSDKTRIYVKTEEEKLEEAEMKNIYDFFFKYKIFFFAFFNGNLYFYVYSDI